MFTLTVQLYAGHTSTLYFTVSVISMRGSILVPNLQAQNSVSINLMNYTITVPFNQPGRTRFMVTARNSFGDTMESAMFPPMGMDGVEGMLKPNTGGSVGLSSRTIISSNICSFTLVLPPPTTPDTTTTGPVSSATPVTTGTTQPPSGEIVIYLSMFLSSHACLLYFFSRLSVVAPVSAGVIAGVVVAVVAVMLIVLMVLLIVGFLIYRNKGEKNHVCYESIRG